MKKYVIISEELAHNDKWFMIDGMVTYYFRGNLIPYSKGNRLPFGYCSYDSKEKADRALKYAKKHNVFEQYSGYEKLADTFKVVEVNL